MILSFLIFYTLMESTFEDGIDGTFVGFFIYSNRFQFVDVFYADIKFQVGVSMNQWVEIGRRGIHYEIYELFGNFLVDPSPSYFDPLIHTNSDLELDVG